MSKDKDFAVQIIQNHPENNTLSKLKLTCLLYLSDWNYALSHNKQITNLTWCSINDYPQSYDLKKTLNSPTFYTKENDQDYDLKSEREIIKLNEDYTPALSKTEKKILDFIIKTTCKKKMRDFYRMVQTTHPICFGRHKDKINFLDYAEKYRQFQEM